MSGTQPPVIISILMTLHWIGFNEIGGAYVGIKYCTYFPFTVLSTPIHWEDNMKPYLVGISPANDYYTLCEKGVQAIRVFQLSFSVHRPPSAVKYLQS